MCVWEICIDASQEVGAVEEKKSFVGVIRQTPTYSRPFIPSTHFLFSSTVPFWSCGRVLPWHPADLLIVWVTSDKTRLFYLPVSILSSLEQLAIVSSISVWVKEWGLWWFTTSRPEKKSHSSSHKKKSLLLGQTIRHLLGKNLARTHAGHPDDDISIITVIGNVYT